MIHDEFSKKSKGSDNMKQITLSQIIPDPGRDIEKSRFERFSFFNNRQLPFFKFLKMKNLRSDINTLEEENLKESKFTPKLKQNPGTLRKKEDNAEKELGNIIYSDTL